MAGTATPIFPQTVKNYVAQILPADTTTKKTLVTGATNGTKIESITVASTDTSARDLLLYLTVSAVDYLLGTVAIPINSGQRMMVSPGWGCAADFFMPRPAIRSRWRCAWP